MYAGFIDKTLSKTFSADTGRIDGNAGNVNDLYGFYHKKGKVTTIGANEDTYEILAKAVIGYNGGETFATSYSFAKLLKYKKYKFDSDRNTNGVCHSCRYTIEVRETIFKQNLCTYIWAGARDATGTPLWCFAYGEKEWVGGDIFDDVQKAALGNAALKIKPVGRVDCLTGVLLP